MQKKLKIKDQLGLINQNINSIGSALTRAQITTMEQIAITQKQLEFERETKDRVNISLKEYEELKRDLKHYKELTEYQQEVLSKIGIDRFIDSINPKTLTVQVVENPMRFNSKIHIVFETDIYKQIPEDKREIGDCINMNYSTPYHYPKPYDLNWEHTNS